MDTGLSQIQGRKHHITPALSLKWPSSRTFQPNVSLPCLSREIDPGLISMPDKFQDRHCDCGFPGVVFASGAVLRPQREHLEPTSLISFVFVSFAASSCQHDQ